MSNSNVTSVQGAPLIEVVEGVRGSEPCFVGTRISVYDVLEYLAVSAHGAHGDAVLMVSVEAKVSTAIDSAETSSNGLGTHP